MLSEFAARNVVRFTPNPRELFARNAWPASAEFSDLGSHGPYSFFSPDGLYELCQQLRRLGKPLYITENGLPDANDDQRPRWLMAHLDQVQRAIAAGCNVRGYFHWTFVDNFEWDQGWGLRFGLVALNRQTQARQLRPSALLYGEIAQRNALPQE